MIRGDLERVLVPGLHLDRAAEILDLERCAGAHGDRRVRLGNGFVLGVLLVGVRRLIARHRVGVRKGHAGGWGLGVGTGGPGRRLAGERGREKEGREKEGREDGRISFAHYRITPELDVLASMVARWRSSTLRRRVSARCSFT